MEERVLIKSQQYNFKKLVIILALIGLVVSLLLNVYLICQRYNYYSTHIHNKYCYAYEWWDDKEYDLLHGGLQESKMDCSPAKYSSAFSYSLAVLFSFGSIVWFLIPPAALALIGGIIYLCFTGYELTVTNKRIFGKRSRGGRVDLPLDSVSAVGIGAFKSITISTSSGRISFSAIKNRNQIHEVVSDLLISRQEQKSKDVSSSSASTVDELKKFKELLDSGIITQEEFDAKKKQLLGL